MQWDEAEAYGAWMNERPYPQMTRIGEDVEIGPECRFTGAASIGDGVKMGSNLAVGDKCIVDAQSEIGDHAVLKPGARVWQQERVPAGAARTPEHTGPAGPQIEIGQLAPDPAKLPAAAGDTGEGGRMRPAGVER